MEIIKIEKKDADRLAPLVAAFRAQLKAYKGIRSQPDIEAGKEEIIEFLESGFPVYAVADNGIFTAISFADRKSLWSICAASPRSKQS